MFSRSRHFAALEALHATPDAADGYRMWRRLRRVELRLNRAYAAACNDAGASTHVPFEEARANRLVAAIFGRLPSGYFTSPDPRGHALKLCSESASVPFGLVIDWGYDGCLAPDPSSFGGV